MDLALIALFVGAALASLFIAWVIGAGSSGSTPFAPAVGAVTQGGNVSEAVGSGLVGGMSMPVAGVILVLVLGAGLMAVGIITGSRTLPLWSSCRHRRGDYKGDCRAQP